MKRNLIICTTPLQVVIAEHIIDLHPDEEFWPMVYSPNDKLTDKYEYYAQRLEAKCKRPVRVIYPKYGKGVLRAWGRIMLDILQGCRLPKFDTVIKADYLAEDAVYVMIKQQTAELKSFDDGLMNVAPLTYEKQKHIEKGRLYKIVTKISGISTEEQQFRARLTEHFTIYKLKNVIEAPKMTYIDLFPANKIENLEHLEREPKEVVSIFLGQPIYEYEYGRECRSVDVTQHLIDQYQIKYYYPHPRERYQIEGVEYINSSFIIEDYLLQELTRDKNKAYKIYTYCSSALINLQGLPEYVEFTAFYPSDCPDRLKETYALLRACGISIVDIDVSLIP